MKISFIIPYPVHGTAIIALESIHKLKDLHRISEIILVQGNNPARQRNKAALKASGDLLYFLDNDSGIDPYAIRTILKRFKSRSITAVGGPSLSPFLKSGYISLLIGVALETLFGALRMRYRYSKQTSTEHATEYHLIGANMAVRKQIFLKLKGFDESFYPNEETDFLRRLLQKNYQIIYDKKMIVYRQHRDNIKDLIKQFYRYGTGRMKQLVKSPTPADIIFIFPVGFLLYLLFVPLLFTLEIPVSRYILLTPILCYFILGFLTALKASTKYKRFDFLFSLPLIFPIIHISYTVGLLFEYIQYLLKINPKRSQVIVRIKMIKVH